MDIIIYFGSLVLVIVLTIIGARREGGLFSLLAGLLGLIFSAEFFTDGVITVAGTTPITVSSHDFFTLLLPAMITLINFLILFTKTRGASI